MVALFHFFLLQQVFWIGNIIFHEFFQFLNFFFLAAFSHFFQVVIDSFMGYCGFLDIFYAWVATGLHTVRISAHKRLRLLNISNLSLMKHPIHWRILIKRAINILLRRVKLLLSPHSGGLRLINIKLNRVLMELVLNIIFLNFKSWLVWSYPLLYFLKLFFELSSFSKFLKIIDLGFFLVLDDLGQNYVFLGFSDSGFGDGWLEIYLYHFGIVFLVLVPV